MINRVPDLSGKSIAIVAMGKSHSQFILAKTHSQPIDEVWAINAKVQLLSTPVARFMAAERINQTKFVED